MALTAAAILVVLGLVIAGTFSAAQPGGTAAHQNHSSASCLAELATAGQAIPMPTPTRLTVTLHLRGGYELTPAPPSYQPGSPASAAWAALSKESGATYRLYLGTFVVPDGLSGSSYNGVVAWVEVGQNIAGMTNAPGARHGSCKFFSAFDVFNATTGRDVFGFGTAKVVVHGTEVGRVAAT